MLVLTRRPQQSIMIGDDIVVTVLEVKGDQIRIGITAPRSVQVYREEVLLALTEANQAAVLTDGSSAPPVPSAGSATSADLRRALHGKPARPRPAASGSARQRVA